MRLKSSVTICIQNKYLFDTVKNFEAMEKEMQQLRHDYKYNNELILEYAKSNDTASIENGMFTSMFILNDGKD